MPAGERRIVSSRHLAEGPGWEASEFEYGMIIAYNSFARWMQRCMAASGTEGMSPLDVLVLHTINHRGRPKTLSDICLVLNIEDTHTVTYAMKKLEKAGLITSGRRGKEKTAEITESGETACLEYRRLREAILIKPMKALGLDENELSRLAATLRLVSGNYDQAARAAAAM